MISTIEQFKKNWQKESQNTKRVLANLTDQTIGRQLVNDHRTLGRIAWHITQSIPEMMEKTGLKSQGPGEKDPVPSSAEEIVKAYELVSGTLMNQVLENWNDESLLIEDELYGEKWARGMTLRIIIDHEIHHRGQMTVLMRLAALNVPGLYGPSKEEWAQYGMKEPEI